MTMKLPKYPDVYVPLVGQDGNAFSILARVKKEMRACGVPPEEITKFVEEAMTGDYDHLLQTCMKWVEVA